MNVLLDLIVDWIPFLMLLYNLELKAVKVKNSVDSGVKQCILVQYVQTYGL